MSGAHEFLVTLTTVLCVAAVTTVLFQRLRQPVVLGYLLAGLIVGPHVPIPFVADREVIQLLSETGVILLMFSLGLEFSLRKLIQVGPSAVITAVIQTSIMVWIGYTTGLAFGWTRLESIFAGAVIAISSTTIIAKAFEEQGIKGRLQEFVVGILIVEDLIAILFMAALTAISTGRGLSAGTLAHSGSSLAVFLIGLVVIGMLVIPRLVRAILRLQRAETTLVASMGICFAVALLAHELGYSVALGAFIAGSLVAESGEERNIAPLVLPVRDMFAAIFFVSVGMLIDPSIILEHWPEVAAFTVIVILGKVCGVTLGAFFTGNGIRTSFQTGMSLAQIGEFSFIIAGLGISLKVTGEFLYSIAVAVSGITTLTTPWLIRAGDPVARFIDRKLPRPFQTFASLYGSWIENMRTVRHDTTTGRKVRRLVKLLLLDSVLLMALVIVAAVSMDTISNAAAVRLGLAPEITQMVISVSFLVLALPFIVGIIRTARGLGLALAALSMPEAAEGKLDLADAPRRMLVVTLQLAIVLVVGLPLLALSQLFFLPRWIAALTLGLFLVFLGIMLWRNAANLQGHIRAGAEVVVEVLMRQAKKGPAVSSGDPLEEVRLLIPGLGEPVPLRLDEHYSAVGKTLAELNVRGETGASILVIVRGEEKVIMPGAGEHLRAGDLLALVGTREAVSAATVLLKEGRLQEATAEPGPGHPV
jgi:CPA2 family monovalent cation:H+ antiporter-2